MAGGDRTGARFWGWVAVRLAAVFVAGLALIVFFREVMIPVLRGDVERIQNDRHKADEAAPPPAGPTSSPP